MDGQRKRELVREYRERKARPGVFAVRCSASGEAWVAASPNLDAQQNGVWFSLRLGSHRNRRMQAAWNGHGEASFAYEILEAFDQPELTPLGVQRLMKERALHWRDALGAQAVFG